MTSPRVAALVHHVRNRLTRVIGALAVADGPHELSDELHLAAGQLATVMALLRSQETLGEVCCHEVDVADFAADLAAEARLLAPAHLEFITRWDFDQVPAPIACFDSGLIRLVLLDALDNAWRHGRRQVVLAVEFPEGRLCFRIHDDGPGFPSALLSGQPGDALPAPGGTGQGLSLARRIAARHGLHGEVGRVELANIDGAQFRLFLP